MTKKVSCPVCNGYGFTLITSECSIQSHVCDNCNGSGELEVPMTHADRIRAMSDEVLAKWLVEQTAYKESAWSETTYLNFLTGRDDTLGNAETDTLKWLQQPAEGVNND